MRIWDWRHILYLCHVFPIFLHVYVRNCRFMHKMGQLLVQGGLNQVHCWNVNIISHVNDGRPCREHCQLLASDFVVSQTYLGTFDVVMQVVSESVDQVDCVVLSLFTYVSWVENCKKWSTNQTQSFTEKHNCPQLSSLREPLSSLYITGMAVWLNGHMSSKPYKLPCQTDKQWQCSDTRIVRSWVKIDNTLHSKSFICRNLI